MKQVWVLAVPWNKDIVTTALESGADGVLVPRGYSKRVKELGLINTIAEDGDLKLGKDVVELEIKGKADEEKAVRLGQSKLLIIKTSDWKIIPLENIVAQSRGIIAEVKNTQEARTAMGILEKGVDGILINTKRLSEIKRAVGLIRSLSPSIKLKAAIVTRIKPLGMGDRVCLDTCTLMHAGQGMLVGNNSDAMFLVHSESIQTPYVAPRPFRVNAGGVHAYTLTPGNRTRYLSEIKAGDEVLIVGHTGKTQSAIVGRSKTEKRPLMFVEAKWGKKKVSLILQNAETIRLVDPSGRPVSIVSLRKGSRILAFFTESGRHFGIKVNESIIEQ